MKNAGEQKYQFIKKDRIKIGLKMPKLTNVFAFHRVFFPVIEIFELFVVMNVPARKGRFPVKL